MLDEENNERRGEANDKRRKGIEERRRKKCVVACRWSLFVAVCVESEGRSSNETDGRAVRFGREKGCDW